MRNAERDNTEERSAARDNGCITRVACILRMTSMDEPRQVCMVRKGNVLIVGLRLHAVPSTARSKRFREMDPRYARRHACKSATTSHGRLRCFHEATQQERDVTDRREADVACLAK